MGTSRLEEGVPLVAGDESERRKAREDARGQDHVVLVVGVDAARAHRGQRLPEAHQRTGLGLHGHQRRLAIVDAGLAGAGQELGERLQRERRAGGREQGQQRERPGGPGEVHQRAGRLRGLV